MKLCPKALGTAAGLFWGIFLCVMTLIAVKNGYGKEQLELLLVGVYPWYSLTVSGAFIGLLVGFVDGFIGCYIFAWLYNRLLCCCCGVCECEKAPVKAVAKKKKK